MQHEVTPSASSPSGAPLPEAGGHRREDSLRLDTRSLGRAPGTSAEVHRVARLVADIGVEMVRLRAGSDLELDLVTTSVEEGVLVTGSATGTATVECARCLGTFTHTVSTDLTELFAYPGSASAAAAEDDEVRLLDGDDADLEPVLVDAFCLEFPLAPTCTDLTGGPCIDELTPEPDGVSGQDSERIDPRWAGLADRLDAPEQP